MEKQLQFTAIFLLVLVTFTSCQAVESIFKVGMGFGIFIVIAIVAVVIYIFSRFKNKN